MARVSFPSRGNTKHLTPKRLVFLSRPRPTRPRLSRHARRQPYDCRALWLAGPTVAPEFYRAVRCTEWDKDSAVLTYEQLDAVADAVFPVLALIGLFVIFRALWRKEYYLFAFGLCGAAYGMALAYGLRAIDQATLIALSLGFDYSTHTAVVFVTTVLLTLMTRRFSGIWLAIWVAYSALMVLQQYHPPADILVTATILGTLYLPPLLLAYQPLPRMPAPRPADGPHA